MFDNVSLVLHNCFVGMKALGANLVIVFVKMFAPCAYTGSRA